MEFGEDMLTEWYDKSVMPARDGVFQVDVELKWFSLWKDGRWHFMKKSVEEAEKAMGKPFYWATSWRGLKTEYCGQNQSKDDNSQTENE